MIDSYQQDFQQDEKDLDHGRVAIEYPEGDVSGCSSMVSKKKGRKGLALDAALSDPEPGATNSCEHIDVSALSTVLSVSSYRL